jgi:hypothetical protein
MRNSWRFDCFRPTPPPLTFPSINPCLSHSGPRSLHFRGTLSPLAAVCTLALVAGLHVLHCINASSYNYSSPAIVPQSPRKCAWYLAVYTLMARVAWMEGSRGQTLFWTTGGLPLPCA